MPANTLIFLTSNSFKLRGFMDSSILDNIFMFLLVMRHIHLIFVNVQLKKEQKRITYRKV